MAILRSSYLKTFRYSESPNLLTPPRDAANAALRSPFLLRRVHAGLYDGWMGGHTSHPAQFTTITDSVAF